MYSTYFNIINKSAGTHRGFFWKGERRALQLLSLSEVWLPTSELELQVTLISKIFHFPCIVALQHGSSSLGVTMRSCRFLQSRRQSSSKPHGSSDCRPGSWLRPSPGEGDQLQVAVLVSSPSAAAEGLVTPSTLVSVPQKPKDNFKPTSLRCLESQNSGKLETQAQNLVL